MERSAIWNYSLVDTHLLTVLDQYEYLQQALLQKFQDDQNDVWRRTTDELATFEARTDGGNQDAVDFFRQHIKDVRDKECLELGQRFGHAQRELAQERAGVEAMMMQLRARFAQVSPPRHARLPQCLY